MDVRVAPATPDDVDAVASLWVALVDDQRAYGSHLLGEVNRKRATATLEQYVHGEGLAVATDGDRPGSIVGFVMFREERGLYDQTVDRGIVDNLFVDPDHRDRGVGAALLEYAESSLAEVGVEVVALSVMADNERARAFYDRRGYRPHRIDLERRLDAE